MKTRGIFLVVVLCLLLVFGSFSSAYAISDSMQGRLEDLFHDIGLAAVVAGGDPEFDEGENVNPNVAFWYLSLSGKLDKYINEETWCYELEVHRYMDLMFSSFDRYSEQEVYQWLREMGYYNPEVNGEKLVIFAGGMGDVFAWEPLTIESFSYGHEYKISGLFLYGNDETGDVNLSTDEEFYDYWWHTDEYEQDGVQYSWTSPMHIEKGIEVEVKSTGDGLQIVSFDYVPYYMHEDTVYCLNEDTGKFDQSFTGELEYLSTEYNNRYKKPSVKIMDRNGNTVPSKYYTVSYDDNYSIGTATVEVSIETPDGYFAVYKTTFEIKLGTPKIKATNNEETGKVKLSWADVEGADFYDVYRSTSKNGTYTRLKRIEDYYYTDNSAKAGTTYYYKVRAAKVMGESEEETIWAYSDDSAVQSRACDLARPTITLSNVASSGKVKVSWDAVSGASKYEVWRKIGTDGEYSKLTTTTGTSYVHTGAKAGTTYYYKVKALYEGKESANSAFSEAKSRACDLARPTITLSNVASSGKVKVSWDAVSGASKYEVWRKIGTDGEYSKLTTTTGTSYVHTGGKAGTTYYYKVKALYAGKESANSAFSEAKSRTCDLGSPSISISITSKGNAKLTWNAVSGAETYKVYRSTSKNGSYTQIKVVTGTSYTDTSASAGKDYYYKIIATHENSNANSAYSNIVFKEA